jgi:AcrR family transcriptional regulator
MTGSLRAEQARLTRQRIAETAARLFVRDGYAATAITGVARDAGVSVQTVYNTFSTKAGLLKAAYDITLAGDADPVPLAERPEVKALYAEPDAAKMLMGYAALGRRLLDRLGPLLLQISAGAAAGEQDLVDHRKVTDQERLRGTAMVARRLEELGALDASVGVEAARDRIWTLNSLEVWHLLTGTLRWDGDAYQEWIGEAMCAATLAGPVARPRTTGRP